MLFEFAAEMERRGERGLALDVEQIGDNHLDRVRRLIERPGGGEASFES